MAPVYETEPMDDAGPCWFLNTVAQGWAAMDALDLLRAVGAIEADLGRVRPGGGAPAPRTIDIDVLLFGACVRDDLLLTLPHPRMLRRRFVLQPLLDLAPALADPRSGRPYLRSLRDLPLQGVRPFPLSPGEHTTAGSR